MAKKKKKASTKGWKKVSVSTSYVKVRGYTVAGYRRRKAKSKKKG